MRAKYMVLPVALAALAGCNDLLTETPRATVVTETFFKTGADARAAIIAAYQPLNSGTLFGTNVQWATIAGSDNGFVGKDEENINIINLTRLNWDPTNGYVTGPWSGFYTIITRSNLILEKVPTIEMPEQDKKQILAEAKFLRALSYFYLVRLYGDVPLVTTTEEQLVLGPRTPKEQVYTQLIQDAKDAEADLPLQWDPDRGRATKGAAETLLADVYLWRSSKENTNEWQQASDWAKKVIDSGTYHLMPNYLDAFLPGVKNSNAEEIFAVQASAAAGATGFDIAVWTWPREMGAGSPGGWGTYVPTQSILKAYPAGDYRKQVSYFTHGPNPQGRDTVFYQEHVYKYRPSARPGTQDVNWPIYRYAEVLLMYAEAQFHLNNVGVATDYVNMVRARARNGTGNENRAAPANLTTVTLDDIFHERRIELAFESKRWFDLVRRGFDYFHANILTDSTAVPANVTPDKMLWPVPQAQRDINPQLTQNPGYAQ